MEKGYRDYGHDIDNTDTVLEAGLGFAVALDKPGGFIGHDAVAAARAAGPPTRAPRADPGHRSRAADVPRRGRAPRRRAVGYVRAASYGHTLGGAVGLAMVEAGEPVTASYLDAGTWTVEINGREYPARASSAPLYDPTNERIRS